MSNLDSKINELFAGYVVRKDLVKAVKGNAIVPTYEPDRVYRRRFSSYSAARVTVFRLP